MGGNMLGVHKDRTEHGRPSGAVAAGAVSQVEQGHLNISRPPGNVRKGRDLTEKCHFAHLTSMIVRMVLGGR